jgi:hypothetical protein
MRIACLLTLMLAMALVAVAEDSSQKQSEASVQPIPVATAAPAWQDAVALSGRSKSELSRKGWGPTEDFNDSVCATMRTYVVARERPGSDATRVVRYARCQPAWKFQLRTADQPAQEDSR